MKNKYIETAKNSLLINILSLLGLSVNIILILYFDPLIYIIGPSIASIPFVYICSISYKTQFEFPLFFVRDRISYWGGLVGGITSLSGYITSYLLVLYSDLAFSDLISLFILTVCLSFSIIISITATLINDIKYTDYIDLEKEEN